MGHVRSKMRAWSRARGNPRTKYWLLTSNSRMEILWELNFIGSGAILKRLKLRFKSHDTYAPLWPTVLRVSSAEDALKKSLAKDDEADTLSRNASQGGFTARTGRLSGGTWQALRETTNEARLYELMTYLLGARTSFGLDNPPLKVGTFKIRYLDEWGAKLAMAKDDKEYNSIQRAMWAAGNKKRR